MRLAALFVEACIAVLVARLASRTVDFATVARKLGWQRVATHPPVAMGASDTAKQIGNVVTCASRLFLLRDACLAEAIAAKWMLARRGESTTLFFGLRIRGKAAVSPPSELLDHAVMHAWLNAGSQPVVGQKNDDYTVLARYI